MRRLYAQIALGVALAVAAGWMSVGLLVPRFQALIEEGLRELRLCDAIVESHRKQGWVKI